MSLWADARIKELIGKVAALEEQVSSLSRVVARLTAATVEMQASPPTTRNTLHASKRT